MTDPIVITIPGARLLSSELSKNARIHPLKKARITRKHRYGASLHASKAIVARFRGYALGSTPAKTWIAVNMSAPVFGLPVRSVTLTRICPSKYMADGDNASTLLSSIRDGVADALGVNDKVFFDNPTESDIQSGKIAIRYEQIDGDWGVRITIEPAT